MSRTTLDEIRSVEQRTSVDRRTMWLAEATNPCFWCNGHKTIHQTRPTRAISFPPEQIDRYTNTKSDKWKDNKTHPDRHHRQPNLSDRKQWENSKIAVIPNKWLKLLATAQQQLMLILNPSSMVNRVTIKFTLFRGFGSG